MTKFLTMLSRTHKQLIMCFLDSIVVIVVLLISFSIRLDYIFIPEGNTIFLIYGSPLVAIIIFYKFKLYQLVIRYISSKGIWKIANAVTIYSLVWGIIALMTEVDLFPRSVVFINWILCMLAMIGYREVISVILDERNYYFFSLNSSVDSNKKTALIYGAGAAGVQLASALRHSSELNIIGFIDDFKDFQGQQIIGLHVYSIADLDYVMHKFSPNEILIAIPSLTRIERLDIINSLEEFPIEIRILPGMDEIAKGEININTLREVNIEDLLGRKSVKSNISLLKKDVTNKVVLITGAGGSIGSELCRQVLLLNPTILILFEMSELALYNIEKELINNGSTHIPIFPILGSINDKSRLQEVFKRFKVNMIYHAAAYKHVPMVEFNNTEGVRNNVFGTMNCAEVAIEEGVESFVLISTDKAVRPTNTMGATKRFSELILQALSKKQNITKFSIVRFGNVIGSSGSVIPLFREQIKNGGPITVTNKSMTRYFMTIREAVELVIQAGSMGKGGDVFILDMGEPVGILDLAHKMIRLSGLSVKDESNPDGDIEVLFTKLRPGEKLYEELLIGKNVSQTENQSIIKAEEEMLPWDELMLIIDELEIAIEQRDYLSIRKLLIKAVPGFKPQSDIADYLYKNE